MKEKIKEFLRNNNFLPITQWNSFEIVHKNTVPTKQEQKDDFNKIKNHVFKKNGLYIYEKNKKIIYVGKGKPLLNRLKDHYQLAYKKLSGDSKYNTFHKFFSSKENLDKLKIYWKEQEAEEDRQVLEKLLNYVLNPTFIFFKAEYERKNKQK